jgi:hypothetical protein
LEDAFLLGDGDALAPCSTTAALVSDDGAGEARGALEIVRLASTMCGREYAYLAELSVETPAPCGWCSQAGRPPGFP